MTEPAEGSENTRGAGNNMVGIICLVGIGLTDLPKSVGPSRFRRPCLRRSGLADVKSVDDVNFNKKNVKNIVINLCLSVI